MVHVYNILYGIFFGNIFVFVCAGFRYRSWRQFLVLIPSTHTPSALAAVYLSGVIIINISIMAGRCGRNSSFVHKMNHKVPLSDAFGCLGAAMSRGRICDTNSRQLRAADNKHPSAVCCAARCTQGCLLYSVHKTYMLLK